LPLALIRKAIKEGWLLSLVYFIHLRQVHRKPVFYNYTLRKISSLIKCSPTTLGTHINILRDKGLLNIKDGHLFLTGSTALSKLYRSFLTPVSVHQSRADQTTALRFVVAKRKLHNQDKVIILKKDIIKLHQHRFTEYAKAKSLLKAKKRLNFNVETSRIEERLVLSNANLGSLCNRSQRTGIKIQKEFNRLGFVETRRNTMILEKGHNRRSFFAKCLSSKHQLSSMGNIFVVLPNLWLIPPAICSMK